MTFAFKQQLQRRIYIELGFLTSSFKQNRNPLLHFYCTPMTKKARGKDGRRKINLAIVYGFEPSYGGAHQSPEPVFFRSAVFGPVFNRLIRLMIYSSRQTQFSGGLVD